MGKAPDALIRVSTGFGGGMGSSHEETCGVLTGAIIALAAVQGRITPDDPGDALKARIQTMRERFAAHFGATRCDTIRLALPDVEGRCMRTVREGARLIAEFLREEGLL